MLCILRNPGALSWIDLPAEQGGDRWLVPVELLLTQTLPVRWWMSRPRITLDYIIQQMLTIKDFNINDIYHIYPVVCAYQAGSARSWNARKRTSTIARAGNGYNLGKFFQNLLFTLGFVERSDYTMADFMHHMHHSDAALSSTPMVESLNAWNSCGVECTQAHITTLGPSDPRTLGPSDPLIQAL